MKTRIFFGFLFPVLIIPTHLTAQDEMASLEIVVYDTNLDGNTIPGAEVEINYGLSTTSFTRPDGRIFFNNIPPARYEITIRKSGYLHFNGIHYVPPPTADNPVSFKRIFLKPIPSNSLSIGGKIKDRKENFIEDVEVNLNIVGKGDQTTRSDRFGNFQFLFPPEKNESVSEFIEKENDYQLNFKKKGFKPYSYPGEIDRRHTWVGEITLKPGPLPFFKKKETGASLIVTGAGLLAAGISLKLKSQDIYEVYENNLNPTSSVYHEMSRIAHYQTANKKHKLGYGLGIGGLAFVVSGAYLLIRSSGKNHRGNSAGFSLQTARSELGLFYRF